MIKPSRTKIITALLASVAAWVGSVDAHADASNASKMSAVRNHLGAASQHADWSALSKACERAAALQGIAVDSDAEETTVSLDLSASVPYCISFDAAANTLAIDLAATVPVPGLRTLILDAGGAVKNVRAELNTIEPQFLTRALVNLGGPVAVSATYENTKLVVRASLADSFEVAGQADTPASAFVASMLAESGERSGSVAKAADACSKTLSELHTALADAKLLLLEREFAGIGVGSASNADTNLTKEIDALAADIERLSVAQHTALNDREHARKAALDAADATGVVAAMKKIESAELAAAARLAELAKESGNRRDQVLAVASKAETMNTPTGSTSAVFDQLDGAFTEIRSDNSQSVQLAGLDAAIAEVAAPEVNMELELAPMAAVKRSESAVDAAVAPPARRQTAASSTFAPAAPFNPIGEVSALHSGEEPIRLAQATALRDDIAFTAPTGGTFQLYRRDVPPEQDPLQQPVTIDFRDMDLLNVVSLLAEKGEINVIAGTEVRGTVTASLQDIPLGRAIEIILRMNGLGIVEEAGVYRITTYEEAVESRRQTRIIFLQNTKAEDIEQTLQQVIRSGGSGGAARAYITSNDETNTVVLSGPAGLVDQMTAVIQQMDITEQVIPTVTRVFQLNHAVPTEIENIIDDVLTNEGEVNSDLRSRQLVVTDTPGKMADIEILVDQLDRPVKQVAIEATVVDVVMDDVAQTGVDWVIERLPSGNVQSASLDANFSTALQGGLAGLSILSGDFDIDLMLFGEVTNNNAEILANPVVVTVENSPAKITIAEEFPFQQQTETAEGGVLTSTAFKDIGTILEVTPRITYQNEIVVVISVKQSSVSGLTPDNIPIEDQREVETSLRIQDGQTVFIGGLRKFQDSVGARKMPILGTIPVVGVLFSNRNVQQDHVELLVFLTCNVIPVDLPELTPYQQERYDDVAGKKMRPDSERVLVESYIHPEIYRDPFYKWRRDK